MPANDAVPLHALAPDAVPVSALKSDAVPMDEVPEHANTTTEDYAPPGESRWGKVSRLTKNAQGGEDRVSLMDTAIGAGETLASGISGFTGSALGGWAGAGRAAIEAVKGKGLDASLQAGANTTKQYQQALTHTPSSDAAKLQGELLATPMSMLSEAGGAVGEKIGGNVGRTVGEAAPEVASTLLGLKGASKTAARPLDVKPTSQMERTAAKFQEKGFALPPVQASKTFVNDIISGWGGKIKTAQSASLKNQELGNTLTKRALGLDEKADLTLEKLQEIRKEEGADYQLIKDIKTPIPVTKKYADAIRGLTSDWQEAERTFKGIAKSKSEITDLQSALLNPDKPISTTAALEQIKELRAEATANYKNYSDPAKLALGKAQRGAANALDDLVAEVLDAQAKGRAILTDTGARIRYKPDPRFAGRDKLVDNYKEGRQRIAKSYDVEAAFNEASGNVDMHHFARLLKSGRPLTKELKDMAEFAQTFPKLSQTPEKIGAHSMFSPWEMTVGGVEAVTAAATGHIGAAVAGPAMLATRPTVRAFGLSDFYQKRGGSASKSRLDTAKRNKSAIRGASPAGAAIVRPGEEQDETADN